MAEIKVILVDDHPVVRKGIRDLLDDAPGIRVVGEGASGREALEQIQAGMPDVLLLDMELPDMTGIEVMRTLKAQEIRVVILALSAFADKAYITESLASGAAGYLIKEEIPENIVEAIRGVSRGEQGWVSRQVAAKLTAWMQEREAGEANRLTPREVEVLHAVVEGKTNQEIGFSLGISDKTVEKHLEGIFAKLGVSSRVEAAVRAVREGLVD
jgi:DNA-binding NarL/FixJ family response regulator